MTCSYSKEFSTASFTDVENAFICEYLPFSSGDTVKVYLYGLFLCQNPKFDQSLSEIAKVLNMQESAVADCFSYWEELGLVNVLSKEPYTVQYLPIRSSSSGKPKKYNAEKYTDFTKTLQAIIVDRMISTSEYSEYFSIMETYSISPDAMIMIVNYCISLKGTNISYRYISKVAKDFGNRGLTTVQKVENELNSYSLHKALIERIFKALNIRRKMDMEDDALVKKWIQELNFEQDNIVFAASKLKKGSMAKLDEFLLELYSMKSFSQREIAEFMDKKAQSFNLAIRINKALSIYVEVLDNVVDTYTNKWLSFGFDDDTLLFIANQCFKQGKNTLQDMDEMIEHLRTRGFIDLSSVGDYFESIKKTDEFLTKLLITAGVNRRPTPWDRDNLSMWKSWNFSEEMIMQAASLSAGKSSPLAYMNGILSKWKNNDIFTVSAVKEQTQSSNDSQENYNREYERRRSLAILRAQKNLEKATEINGFADEYSKLNSLEKDLAYAEYSNNSEMLKQLEDKKEKVIKSIEIMLKTISLSFNDLSPVFACKKCNDTGYVGTHRCDCFNKKV